MNPNNKFKRGYMACVNGLGKRPSSGLCGEDRIEPKSEYEQPDPLQIVAELTGIRRKDVETWLTEHTAEKYN